MTNQTKTIIAIVSFCTSLISWPIIVSAQSPVATPTTTQEAIIDGKEINDASAASTQAIKELILKKVAEKAEETDAANDLDNLSDWRRAVLGQVEKITDSSIAVNTKFGNLVIPTGNTNDGDLSIWQKNKKTTTKAIEIGDWLLILGTTKISQKNQSDFLTSLKAQSLTIFDQDPRPKTPFMEIGTVKNMDKTSLTLFSRSTQEEIAINFDNKISYLDQQGVTASAKLIQPDIAVLVTGYKQNESFIATTIKSLAEMKTDNE